MKIIERKTRFVESCPELTKRFFRGAPVRTELHFGGEYNDLMPQHLFTEKKIKGFKSLEI